VTLSRGDPSPHDRAVAHQLASVLLAYPDETLLGRLDDLRAATGTLPAALRIPLERFLDHLGAGWPRELAADYVATFDLRRRCCLYLTYYAYGDTRKRGMALLRFKHAYRSAGLVLTDGELPDALPVVLEFAATGDADAGMRLLTEHRGGLELLRLALEDAGSPYADVVTAICATLPPLRDRDRAAVARLAREGPPQEEVGLEPFAPPEYMGART
jgi:nitrate reductase molybdenum cofactor assembly chaperone NarJ/NarW